MDVSSMFYAIDKEEMEVMFSHDNLYRWCDAYGGGIVIADSLVDAQKKLEKMFEKDPEGRNASETIIWPWHLDDYYNKENPDVLDVYGG